MPSTIRLSPWHGKNFVGAILALFLMGTPFGFTLLLVPVLYSIFVLDLKLVKWEGPTK